MQFVPSLINRFSQKKFFPSLPVFYLYLSNFFAIGFSVVITYAWGHWVDTADYNAIQLIIRYAGILGIFALPGMNEAAGLAAGKNDMNTAAKALGYRFLVYFILVGGLIAIAYYYKSIFPGLSKHELSGFAFYSPALLIPPFALGIFLSLKRNIWAASSRAVTAAFPVVILGTIFILGGRSNISDWYLFGIGAMNLLLLIPIFMFPTDDANRQSGLLRYGVETSVIRWPELILGLETFVLAMCLSPLHLSIFFLADRASEHLKSFLSNNFSDAFGRYSRLTSDAEIMAESSRDFKNWIRNFFYQILIVLLIIPMGMVLWRKAYWDAIPLAMGFFVLVFLMTPFTFIRFEMIARKIRSYQTIHSILYPVSYISTLILLAPHGIWGVLIARVVAAAVGIGIASYFRFFRFRAPAS
jgi:hypothetical protein